MARRSGHFDPWMHSALVRAVRRGLGPLAALAMVLVVFSAVLGPLFWQEDPTGVSADRLQGPSPSHPLGTDDLGRDVLARVLAGTRTSLKVGVGAGFVSVLVGLAIGMPAGFWGGWLAMVLMRATEVVQAIPRFFLALVVIVLLGARISVVTLVIGILSYPVVARVVRAQVLSLKEREYVLAAYATGLRSWAVLLRHILPNAASQVVVTGSLLVGNAILIEAGLSFLGVSDPMSISLGSMLNTAQPYLREAWWLSVFPGTSILVLVLAINLLGDELNEAMDPRRALQTKG